MRKILLLLLLYIILVYPLLVNLVHILPAGGINYPINIFLCLAYIFIFFKEDDKSTLDWAGAITCSIYGLFLILILLVNTLNLSSLSALAFFPLILFSPYEVILAIIGSSEVSALITFGMYGEYGGADAYIKFFPLYLLLEALVFAQLIRLLPKIPAKLNFLKQFTSWYIQEKL